MNDVIYSKIAASLIVKKMSFECIPLNVKVRCGFFYNLVKTAASIYAKLSQPVSYLAQSIKHQDASNQTTWLGSGRRRGGRLKQVSLFLVNEVEEVKVDSNSGLLGSSL